MLNLKKVIALVCVFALALSTVAFGATYTDVTEESAYYEAVETLNKLNVITGYEDGTFKPEDGVTRAEMAALIARIQGYGETAAGSANTGFTDVPSTHWASGYVANAAGMGIINGYGDGTFGPEDPVLYEQAVKMIMATLGYTPFAEKNGGYPTGYLAAAQRYDVSLAVANAAVGSEANRGTVAQLLVNALDTPLMIQAKWNTNGEVEYVIADGSVVGGVSYGYKTLMSENLGYVKLRGIVTENFTSNITTGKNINTEDDVEVTLAIKDSYMTENTEYLRDLPKEFLVGDTDVAEMLGRSVIGYVKKIDNEWTMISAAIDTARNEELVISLDQYADHTQAGSTTAGEFRYYREGANDVTKVTIPANDNFTVVFNGIGKGEIDLDTYLASAGLFGGAITFIDNDDVKGYDVAFVDLASTAVVDEVTEDGIYFKNNCTLYDNSTTLDELAIDEDDTKTIVAILKDGEVIDPSELVEYDVLSVFAESTGANYIVAEVVANQVVGTIASTKKSDTSAFPSLNALGYKVADTWYDVAAGAYGTQYLEIGAGGTFYIDAFGKIAAFVEDAALAGGTTAKYGYILGISVDEPEFGGGSADLKVQMLTGDGVGVYSVKSNAKVEYATAYDHDNDGGTTAAIKKDTLDLTEWDVTTKGAPDDGDGNVEAGEGVVADASANASVHAPSQWAKFGSLEDQVVQYVTNGSGYLTLLTEAGYDKDFEVKGSGYPLANEEYDADRTKLGNIGYVEEDAIVFIIDSEAANCRVGGIADLEHENKYVVNVAYKDKSSNNAASVLVIPYSSIQTSMGSGLAVVVEAGSSTNDDGEAVWTITYLVNGEEVTADTNAEVASTVALPAQGDVLKIKVGSDGLITNIVPVWTSVIRTANDNTIAVAEAYTEGNSLEKFYGGIVTSWDKDYKDAVIASLTDTDGDGALDDESIASTPVSIARAVNVYTVDATGKNVIVKRGGTFKNFAKLYGTAAVNLTFLDGTTMSSVAVATAQGYADHLYVREYDGEIIDVIIVKGSLDKVQ